MMEKSGRHERMMRCHAAGLWDPAHCSALPLGKLQIFCKVMARLWFPPAFPSSAGGLKEVGEQRPSSDLVRSIQVGQVYEEALLGGFLFRWGCPAFEGIICDCRYNGR